MAAMYGCFSSAVMDDAARRLSLLLGREISRQGRRRDVFAGFIRQRRKWYKHRRSGAAAGQRAAAIRVTSDLVFARRTAKTGDGFCKT